MLALVGDEEGLARMHETVRVCAGARAVGLMRSSGTSTTVGCSRPSSRWSLLSRTEVDPIGWTTWRHF